MVPSSAADSPTDPTHHDTQGSPRLSSIAAVIITALNRANALHDDTGYPRLILRLVNLAPDANVIISAIHPDARESANVDRPGVACVIMEGICASQNEIADTGAEERKGRKRRASSVRTLLRKKIFKKLHR
jgi:hypothetical protein